MAEITDSLQDHGEVSLSTFTWAKVGAMKQVSAVSAGATSALKSRHSAVRDSHPSHIGPNKSEFSSVNMMHTFT